MILNGFATVPPTTLPTVTGTSGASVSNSCLAYILVQHCIQCVCCLFSRIHVIAYCCVMDLKECLKGKLTEKELKLVKTSFDIVGSTAILEVPEELAGKEKLIAEAVFKIQKNVKTVCKKSGDRSGIYRLRKYRKILGNDFETIHKESGCQFKLDIRKTYFSVRESTERLRISSQINKKENILALFSGVGPFGIIIAKNHPDCKVDMVEINPAACKYAEENIRINKVSDRAVNYCGDIRKIHKQLGKYDRIIMPLPETACKFLDISIEHCRKNGIIYLYGIAGEQEGIIENTIKKFKNLKLLERRKVLPYAPGVWKECWMIKKVF